MRRERGFTLLEILVALVLIGLLAGVLVPTVANQLSRGETDRVVQDLGAVETAIKAFRVDVQRWPVQIRHLVVKPTGAPADSIFGGGTLPPGLSERWRGPYLELGSIPGDTLVTAAGGVILGRFVSVTWGATPFVAMKAKGINQASARSIRLTIDGDTAVGDTPYAPTMSGRIRWKSGDPVAATPDTLIYLISPL